jgi:cytochrome c553
MPRTVSAALFVAFFFATAAAIAQKQPAPFAAGDANTGKALVERDCVSCHAAKFPGDPDRMYTRPEHRVKTPAKLLAQVQACNTNLAKGYFPEEEEHIAAYLNLEFYKFAP